MTISHSPAHHPGSHSPTTWRRALAVVTAGLATLLVVGSGVAVANPPVDVAPESDANCDTIPLTYPGNGVPVPADALCELVVTDDGVPVAEVWAWGDVGGLHWYNYLADGYTEGPGSALTMCATEDEAAAEVTYDCTTDSYYLLFTTPSMFITWPASVEGNLYYCESVDVIGSDGWPWTARACGTLRTTERDDGAEPVPTTPPPTSPPPSAPPPPTSPSDPPATEPADPPGGADDPADEPSVPASEPPADAPVTTSPTDAAPALPGDDPRALPEEAMPGATAQPVDTESVALVGGAAFPLALVFMVAAALGLGGVAVLAGPGALAAIRRRPRHLE